MTRLVSSVLILICRPGPRMTHLPGTEQLRRRSSLIMAAGASADGLVIQFPGHRTSSPDADRSVSLNSSQLRKRVQGSVGGGSSVHRFCSATGRPADTRFSVDADASSTTRRARTLLLGRNIFVFVCVFARGESGQHRKLLVSHCHRIEGPRNNNTRCAGHVYLSPAIR